MRDTGWFKSTRSTSGGDNCVEVRITEVAAHVRDSKNATGARLLLSRTAFARLVAASR
jgi:hypothetical protein